MAVPLPPHLFATAIIGLGAALPAKELSTVIEKVAMEGLESLVQLTPVDTGRARGNWEVGSRRNMRKHDEAKKDKNGDYAIARGTEVIEDLTSNNKIPKKIWIINNVPYIEDLEHGPPKGSQKSQAMLSTTINNLQSMFNLSSEGGSSEVVDDYSDLPI